MHARSSQSDPASVALSGCRISRPAVFRGGIEIVSAPRLARGFSERLSEGLGVCLKVGGAHGVVSDGRRLDYPADSVCVRFPGSVWSSEVAPVGFVSIDVAPALLPPDLSRRPMRFLQRNQPDVRRFVRVLEHGETLLAQTSALGELIDWLSVAQVLAADSLRDDGPGGRAVRRAQDFLRSSSVRNPTLDELAAATRTNKFVLLRYFKKELGVGPHGYLTRLRVERARDLLARGTAPIEVAAAVGFADQGHLGRHFKRIVGIPPGQYARQVRSVVAARR